MPDGFLQHLLAVALTFQCGSVILVCACDTATCVYMSVWRQTLVKRAKHGDDAADIDRVMMSNIAKRARFKEADLDPDAEYDFDAGVDL